jgi:zinc transport system substrate-binding protein
MRTFVALVIGWWLAGAVALGADKRLRIITSFFPIYCWTTNVTGDRAVVENLLPPKAEPHTYAFTPGDARKLAAADLVIINGLGLETWVSAYLRNVPDGSNRLVTTTAGLRAQLIYGGEHHHHHHGHGDGAHDHGSHHGEQPNEHTWLDPMLAAQGVSNILAALQRVDPAHAATYASNAVRYIERLEQLDYDISLALGNITSRSIVTYHDAFPYWAQRYNLEVVGVVEQVAEVNPGPRHLSRLARTMREEKVRAICVPVGGATRIARQIASDLKVRLVELDTLESGPLTPSAYEERMRYNANALAEVLK